MEIRRNPFFLGPFKVRALGCQDATYYKKQLLYYGQYNNKLYENMMAYQEEWFSIIKNFRKNSQWKRLCNLIKILCLHVNINNTQK